jgi:DNA-binding NtrC family response regulator
MTKHRQRVLIVDDQEDLLRGVSRIVENLGHEVDTAPTAEEAYEMALSGSPDLVITDLNLPGQSGMDLLRRLSEAGVDTTTIVLTGYGTIDSAIEATRRGVYDYLLKPVRPKELEAVIRKALERASLREEVRSLRREMVRSGKFQQLTGRSSAMLKVFRLIEQVSPAEAPVLITGESGTGKELVARAIHAMSSRAKERLVAVNCAAIPDDLLESEMFGHEKGAFTGAVQARKGCFELAHEGTLFLDEIGDMPPRLQSKLLRVLESGTFQRVGGEREMHVDVRIVTATNAPLEQLIESGSFRKDLYFRLNVFHIALPPLRDRRDDIPLLVEQFIQQIAENEEADPAVFADETLELLRSHDWPGNVRELRNVVHRATIVSGGKEVRPTHLPPQIRPQISVDGGSDNALTIPIGVSIADVEKEMILRTLEAYDGNKTRTAATLGISTKTLYTKLQRYGEHPGGGS